MKKRLPRKTAADEVYHYDTRDHVFEKAEFFTERKRAKGQEIGKQEPVKKTAAEKAIHPEQAKHKSADMEL